MKLHLNTDILPNFFFVLFFLSLGLTIMCYYALLKTHTIQELVKLTKVSAA